MRKLEGQNGQNTDDYAQQGEVDPASLGQLPFIGKDRPKELSFTLGIARSLAQVGQRTLMHDLHLPGVNTAELDP